MVELVREGEIMKKIFLYTLAILSCMTLFACGQANNEEIENDNPIIEEKAELATVTKQVVYEDDQLIVTVHDNIIGFAENQFSFPLKLTFENKTNKELTVSEECVLINDVLVENNNMLTATMNPKESVEYDWWFDDNAYSRNNIKTMSNISFMLIKYEKKGNDYKTSRTDLIRIESDHKDYVQKMNTEGTVLIDEQGFKIVAQEAELDVEGEKEYNCWFYLENNTDKGTWFQIEKMSVNGFVIKTSTMPRDYVPANTKGYKSILFTEDDIEKYGLNPIDRMYIEVAVLEDLGPHSYGEEIIKNRSVKVEYGE